MSARLQQVYEKEIRPAMMQQFGYTNTLQVPKLEKIVINMGVGEATEDRKRVEGALTDLTRIAGFKLREGMVIGAKVTLRKDRMYEFLDRLVNIALPRVRDFRGIQGKCFDGRGNFAMGLKEQIVFPEIDYDQVDKVRGMDIVICTSAKTDDEAKALLKAFNMPLVGK